MYLVANEIDKTPEKIYIGVSWPYANGNIHIGHLAGQYIVCDIFARYHRLKGNEVLMVSGSDCHGAPVVFKAEQEGIEPEELAERSHQEITETYKQLGLIYENYTKTSTETHKEVAQNIFTVLKENGYLVVKKSKQYFDPKVERFLPDRYVKGTCPNCGADNARGDECPECGTYLEPEELLNPYSTLSDATPELRETKHFYMDLRALQGELNSWVGDSSVNWRKWVREFSIGWLKQGLEPRPVTRDMKYGIPVPVKGWDDKVLYVWFEAVIGYLSASIEWAEKQGDPSAWEDFWKDPLCKHFYFIAGGNVPFHTILWPAELVAYSEKYQDNDKYEKNLLPGESKKNKLNLPYDVPGNNMLFYRGKKMSKGDSTGITVESLLDDYGPDTLRYFFVRYAPEKHDREFIWRDLIDANNNELVANLGNFIYRATSFTYSRFDGKVPEGELEEEVKLAIDKAFEDIANSIEEREFVKSVEHLLELGHFANKYFNDKTPWVSIKKDPKEASVTLYNSMQLVSAINTLIRPFTPFAAEKINDQLSLSKKYDPNKELEESGVVTKNINSWEFEEIPSGHKIKEPEIIFEKHEYTEKLEKLDNPDCEVCEAAKSMEFEKDNKLKDIPTRWKIYSFAKPRKLKPDQREELQIEIDKFLKELKGEWRDKPLYKGYRELHDKYSEFKDLPGSPELLINKILEEDGFPKINGFVDIYNYVSLLTGVSIGAHDIEKMEDNPRLVILHNDLDFNEIGTGDKTVAKKGEYAYIDKKGVLCRLDIKQSQRTRVSNKSSDIVVIFQGHEHIEQDKLEEAEKMLDILLVKYGVVPEE